MVCKIEYYRGSEWREMQFRSEENAERWLAANGGGWLYGSRGSRYVQSS